MHTALRVPIVVVAPQQWDAGCARSSFSMFAAPRRYGIVSRASSETEVTTKETPSSTSAQTGTGPSGDDPSSSGRIIAGMAVAAGVALFFSTKLANPGPSLAALEQDAIPLDVALRNGKPTVMEFYADWCKVCQLMAQDTYELERKHRDDVNFVMLNVDNTKWAPEIAQFGVPGIPEYVFLDGNGKIRAVAVGQVPRSVLEEDFDALAKGTALPYANVASDFSDVPSARGRSMPAAPRQASPLDHGL